MDTVVVSVRLDSRLVSALDALGRERSEVVREALEEWLRRRKVAELVREDEAAYRSKPVEAGEFDWLAKRAAWPADEDWADVGPSKSPPPRARKRKRRGH